MTCPQHHPLPPTYKDVRLAAMFSAILKSRSFLQHFTESETWSYRQIPFLTMLPTTPPRAAPGSNEELLATQARLYRLLVEATDRLERERGLPRTRAAEAARLSRNDSVPQTMFPMTVNGKEVLEPR